jgi:hypothetical protein
MFFDDDLPVWGFIGKTESKPGAGPDGKPQLRQFLFTHFHFDIGFNGNQVGVLLRRAWRVWWAHEQQLAHCEGTLAAAQCACVSGAPAQCCRTPGHRAQRQHGSRGPPEDARHHRGRLV